MSTSNDILSAEGVGIQFGGLTALQGVSFSIKPNEILSVIGPNGAGKTTLFNIVTGIYEATHGSVMILRKNPAAPFRTKTFISIALFSILCGFALFSAVNIEGLWAALITDQYVYQQPFAWSSLAGNFINFWRSCSWGYSVGLFLIGSLIGAGTAWTLWDSARLSPEIIMRKGLARTFQNIRIFPKMSVIENILVGMHIHVKTNVLGDSLKLPRSRKQHRNAIERAQQILELVHLSEVSQRSAAKLSYGHQRRLEIARALASMPKLILLDEPAAGMNPSEAEELMEIIKNIKAQGISILLIEHHMNVVMGISDRIIVLDYGRKIAEGSPLEVRSNPAVVAAYLGKEEESL